MTEPHAPLPKPDEIAGALPQDKLLAPLIERSLAEAWWRLRFPEPLESIYQSHIARQKWLQTNIGGGLCLVVFNTGAYLDYIGNPGKIWLAVFLRLVVVTIPCALLFWFSYRVRDHRKRDGMTAGAMLLIAVVVNILLIIRGSPPTQIAFSMALMVIIVNIVLPLSVVMASVASVGAVVITALFRANYGPLVQGEPHLPVIFVTITCIITLLANHRLDTALRRLYLVLLREQLRGEEVRRENRDLNTFSYTDTLTGIANRRRLDETMQRAWQKAETTQEPLALLIIDIDHFKRYNDTYGHPAGDACLRRVAEAVAGSIRSGRDLAARMGGEEFAVLLEDCDIDTAHLVAERIHASLAATSLTATAGLFGEPVTVSIGLAVTYPFSGGTIEDFITAADSALYIAKHRGRNQTCTGSSAA
ncbi:diguanylate cyclase (GGDEF) domain-containing protein [Rhizobium sp. RU35A]|uniref:GGDEF domain-containing protein n=1 Tax=Rhizobium sp. RU35A TaxID=1907414 RepID=UPI000955863C|nr:diguanylate cyclase [Rhizobium sp. RU35A]SIQ57623.1 diguanylate cyclase (GGDEF) domain-containing protein [Rhizobium sp. RU35A]